MALHPRRFNGHPGHRVAPVNDDLRDWVMDEPGFMAPDDASISLIASLTDHGAMCCECGSRFTEAHGQKTACEFCWKRLSVEERASVLRASHPEVNRSAHRAEAKKHRARKSK